MAVLYLLECFCSKKFTVLYMYTTTCSYVHACTFMYMLLLFLAKKWEVQVHNAGDSSQALR